MNAKNTSIPKINNGKVKIFLIFLVLSSIIWLLIELSKSYVSSVAFDVKYINAPKNSLLESTPTNEINLAIKASGFSIIRYHWNKKTILFDLENINKSGNFAYILPNQQLPNLTSQLPGETEVVKVFKDTIFVNLGTLISKKVPVKTNLDINFKHGYNLIKEPTIYPDSIVVSGTKKVIDSINKVETHTKKVTEVFENESFNVPLKLPKQKHFIATHNKVKVVLEVDKLTEGTIAVPVNIINVPGNIKVKPYPAEVEVTYRAGIKNFGSISSNSFEIVYDYNDYKKDSLVTHLTPKIIRQNEEISSLKINPERIEFLIEKQ
ncbi:MAG TPA: CdaR family protein [Flavobacteriaceae bacterium]|nr:CdaR family protein [Flavobacteriaceae bacterium]